MEDPDFQEAVAAAGAAGLLPPRTLLAQVDQDTASQALDWLPGDVVLLSADIPAPYVLQESRRTPGRRALLEEQAALEEAGPWLRRERKGSRDRAWRWGPTEHCPVELRPVVVEVVPFDAIPLFAALGGEGERLWLFRVRGGREVADHRALGALLVLVLRAGVQVLEGDWWGLDTTVREGEAWARRASSTERACWIGPTVEIVPMVAEG